VGKKGGPLRVGTLWRGEGATGSILRHLRNFGYWGRFWGGGKTTLKATRARIRGGKRKLVRKGRHPV